MSVHDSALITCPNFQTIIKNDVLEKCFHRDHTILCLQYLVKPNESLLDWLGLPFAPGTKLTFQRHHTEVSCQSHSPSLVNLGGRNYLASQEDKLVIPNGTLSITPLTVYEIPCDMHVPDVAVGIGSCPEQLGYTLPVLTNTTVQYVPW